jgi:hypothetical protein
MSESTPDPLQPTVPAVRDRQEHGKAPDLDPEVLDHRAEREEAALRADAGEQPGASGDGEGYDPADVPPAED